MKQDTNPLVTIAIPTYNRGASFLPGALADACRQTYPNLDIFVSDNASQDTTQEVVESFHDPRIRYHRHPENLGASRNTNYCIEQSRGVYTLLLMDDDSIDPDFVECCVNAARGNPGAGLIRTGARVVDGAGALLYNAPNEVVGLNFTQFVLAWTEGKTAPFLCNTLFRTQPLQESGMTSRHQLWCDVIAEMPIACHHGRVDIPDIKASFRMHGGELTVRVGIEDWCDDSMQLLDLVCDLAPADAATLRAKLNPFLATLNYQNALRLDKPWLARLRALRTVHRHFGTRPKAAWLTRQAVEETGWFKSLREVKRALLGHAQQGGALG
jgi:glycosyltransferase involved in cell wall biosynthesis